FELFVYNKTINVPNGVIIRDANEIISHKKIFLDSRGSYASFADWFRFKMLFELGGWWSDLDSICVKHIDVDKEYCFSTEQYIDYQKINCGNIKAPKDSEFLDECLFEIRRLIMARDYTWGKYGLNMMDKVLSNYENNE